jgi:hypothetical protein
METKHHDGVAPQRSNALRQSRRESRGAPAPAQHNSAREHLYREANPQSLF